MLDSAEKNIQSARQILREMMGSRPAPMVALERAKVMTVASAGKIIEGVFDGQNMMGPDGKKYPVQANYASKSKLVEGKTYKVLLASLTYFKAENGDEITVVVPRDQDAEWAAVENVIKKAGEMGGTDSAPAPARDVDSDLELGEE